MSKIFSFRIIQLISYFEITCLFNLWNTWKRNNSFCMPPEVHWLFLLTFYFLLSPFVLLFAPIPHETLQISEMTNREGSCNLNKYILGNKCIHRVNPINQIYSNIQIFYTEYWIFEYRYWNFCQQILTNNFQIYKYANIYENEVVLTL